MSLCVLLLRYQPEGDIHGFVNFLSEEQNSKRKEGVLAECEKDACSPTSEGGGDEYGGPPTNTCGAKNLPSLGDNEMLIGKPDKNAYTAGHPNYGTVDMGTGIEAEESEGGVSRRLKKLIGPRYYTLRIRLGLPGKMDRPTVATGKTVTVCVLLLFISQFAFCSFIIFGESRARLSGLLKGQPAKTKELKNQNKLSFSFDSRVELHRRGPLVGPVAAGLLHHLHRPPHRHHPAAAREPQASALHGALRALRARLGHAGQRLPHAQAVGHHLDPLFHLVLHR